MAEVLADADRERVTLRLAVSPSGPMTYLQLEKWYQRLGFKLGTKETLWYMERLPHVDSV